jgi:hypothetical protein
VNGATPSRDPGARAARRYARSLASGGCSRSMLDSAAVQAERYRERMAAMQAREALVRQVLNQHQVKPYLFVQYLNFARHLMRVCRRFSGLARLHLTEAAVDRWTAIGLDPGTLEAICRDALAIETEADRRTESTYKR